MTPCCFWAKLLQHISWSVASRSVKHIQGTWSKDLLLMMICDEEWNQIYLIVAQLCWFLIHSFASGSLSSTSKEKLRAVSQQTSSFGFCICFHFYYWNLEKIEFFFPSIVLELQFQLVKFKLFILDLLSSTLNQVLMAVGHRPQKSWSKQPENVDIADYRSNAMAITCYNQCCMRSNKNILCNKHLFGIV